MRALGIAAASSLALLASPAIAKTPEFARHVCPNGLEVIVAERHGTPVVTIEIAVHNGSMTEPPEYNGLSHLYEHMFFKGNKALPDQLAYMARARELGLLWNGTTHTERVNYFFTTTSDHLDGAMVFMRDAITSPLFDAKELERERVVVTGELDRNESDPGYYYWHETSKRLYWKYPSRKDPLGYRKTVLAATTEMMRTIQKRYYVPNNSLLVITGDVKADDVFSRADSLYANWSKAADPFVKYPIPKHPPPAKSEVLVIEQPVQTFQGQIAMLGPSTGDDTVAHTYAADLVSTMVAEPASKFQKALVDSGACVRAGIGYWTQKYTGQITIEFESTEAKIEECTRAVIAELPKLKSADYFGDDEMKNAIRRMDVQLAKQRETTEGLAHQITTAWTSMSLDYYRTYFDRAAAVTRADIAKMLDAYVYGKTFIFAALESPKIAQSGFDKARFESLFGIVKGGKK
jgi:zinc protease